MWEHQPVIQSPARFLAGGEMSSIRMYLTFYDAVIDIRADPLRPGGGAIDIQVSTAGWGGNPPSLQFGLDRESARAMIATLRENPPESLETWPVDCGNFGFLHEHARNGTLRAFGSVFGVTGRHLLDAALWALDEDHQPECLELTHALAKYWVLKLGTVIEFHVDSRHSHREIVLADSLWE